eukprot:gene22557-biopygen19648
MNTLYAGLKAFGASAKTNDLGGNLLLWMSLVFVNASSNAQRFTMTGTPLSVFDRDHTDGAVSSVRGNCNVSSVTTFDTANGMMTLSWNYADFIAEPKCMFAMDPATFGYNTLTKPEMFTIGYDIRTLITNVAVNMHILTLDQLEEIEAFHTIVYPAIFGGIPVDVRFYYDPKFPGMKPIQCVLLAGAEPSCVMQIGSAYAFPAFNHLGSNLTSPELCDCGVLTVDMLADKTHNCNVFRFVSGIFFNNAPYDADYMFDVRAKFGSADAGNRQPHEAMFIASSYGQNSPLAEQLNSEQSLEAAYDFCKVGNTTCGIITFSSYDSQATSWAVSNYYTLVQNGACRDTITPDQDSWAQLAETPYGPLVQNYQQCSYDMLTTLQNQAGIAVGNIQIVAPLCVAFLMIITWLHKWWNKVPLDES